MFADEEKGWILPRSRLEEELFDDVAAVGGLGDGLRGHGEEEGSSNFLAVRCRRRPASSSSSPPLFVSNLPFPELLLLHSGSPLLPFGEEFLTNESFPVL